MAQLFATHFRQQLPPALIEGQYDPEQELWVGDNQLEGASPFRTQTTTNTQNNFITTSRPTTTFTQMGIVLDLDSPIVDDMSTSPDTDTDPDA